MFSPRKAHGRGFSGAIGMASGVLCGRSLLVYDLEAAGCLKRVGIATARADWAGGSEGVYGSMSTTCLRMMAFVMIWIVCSY